MFECVPAEFDANCEQCGKGYFFGKRGLKKTTPTCSPSCREKLKNKLRGRPRYRKACITCGEEYLGEKKQLYCSAKCRTLTYHPIGISEIRRIDRTRTCPTCSLVFTNKPGRKRRFCSPRCAQIDLHDGMRSGRIRRGVRVGRPKLPRICPRCGVSELPEFKIVCRGCLKVKQRVCVSCGDVLTVKKVMRCDPCREAARSTARRINRAKRKALERGAVREAFDPMAVFARDKWHCQLCGVSTPKRLRGKNESRSPELDHIVPLSLGGEHTMRNSQCLCRSCNLAKGATVRGQLFLF